MRIWVQSNTALHSDPAWKDYTSAMEEHLREVKSEATELKIMGVAKMERNVDGSAIDRFVNVRQVIDCGIEAQLQGYDAFLMVGMGTAGYEELREALTIPVVYAESVVWNLARWQYGRFGLLSNDAGLYFRRLEQIRSHGSLPFFVPGDYCTLSVSAIRAAFKDPREVVDAVKASSLRTVQDGAEVLIPVFNVLNDLLASAGIRRIHGVPVLDTAGVSVRAAEFLVGARRKNLL